MDLNEAPLSATPLNAENEANGETQTFSRNWSVAELGKTALQKLYEEAERPSIVTCCQALDTILGGGIALGQVTEFCGMPGVGKTQLGIQLAINAFIPHEFGGVDGRAIYIDTEGSFIPTRVMEFVKGLIGRLDGLAQEDRAVFPDGFSGLTENFVKQHLTYFRVHNYVEQLALIGQLKHIVEELNAQAETIRPTVKDNIDGRVNRPPPHVRCIVLDSATFHFRSTTQFPDHAVRTRLLLKMASELSALATSCNLAIVVMNHMTSKHVGPSTSFVPALGEQWGHQISTRVLLEADPVECVRMAILVKSSSMPYAKAPFIITPSGIDADLEQR